MRNNYSIYSTADLELLEAAAAQFRAIKIGHMFPSLAALSFADMAVYADDIADMAKIKLS